MIGDKGGIAFGDDRFQFVPRDPAGVYPAALEIGGLIDVVIERAAKARFVNAPSTKARSFDR
jgi:hypothetical protein